jgi:hypothetical protein
MSLKELDTTALLDQIENLTRPGWALAIHDAPTG